MCVPRMCLTPHDSTFDAVSAVVSWGLALWLSALAGGDYDDVDGSGGVESESGGFFSSLLSVLSPFSIASGLLPLCIVGWHMVFWAVCVYFKRVRNPTILPSLSCSLLLCYLTSPSSSLRGWLLSRSPPSLVVLCLSPTTTLFAWFIDDAGLLLLAHHLQGDRTPARSES